MDGGHVSSEGAGAGDIEGRAIFMFAAAGVPPPPGKLGLNEPYGSVDRACYIRRSGAKGTYELVVEFRRANASALDFLQKLSEIHFFATLKHATVQAENL